MMKMMKVMMSLVVSMALIDLCSIESTLGQVVPYKTKGVGVFNPLNGEFSGSGTGTHLGRHTFTGNVIVTPTDKLVFDFVIPPDNPQETIAANGDKIYFSGSGQVELFPLNEMFTEFSAVWSGTYVVEGGTGRFASIAPGPQPLNVTAINDPFTLLDPQWTFRWQLNGFIQLQ